MPGKLADFFFLRTFFKYLKRFTELVTIYYHYVIYISTILLVQFFLFRIQNLNKRLKLFSRLLYYYTLLERVDIHNKEHITKNVVIF